MSAAATRSGSTPRRPSRARIPGVERERAFWDAGMGLIAGIDEVGRGAIAGPLVAEAKTLPHLEFVGSPQPLPFDAKGNLVQEKLLPHSVRGRRNGKL